ncbi:MULTISPECIES: aldo/keto reductase [Sodalis]|jgi:aryl-alcohol dehydrogenase-like predicted oxidoreductase|uniref:Aryl-alcohol dehydrogenase-like predicted oxidoreductase n=1 Tax=Sodalis ligni TaxID=2697027 RepID=A0A4R1NAQ6_9GAMM|nr:aldo/keto reductase [Sodalis ligni]TCL04383.1 aryl-alcohol dehydrogenase-like predicted oxidoreductase [Sodalis ligni]
MKMKKLGRSGLDVSALCLGCMTYGAPDKSGYSWTLDERQSRTFIQKALELGINFFDTANAYSKGHSEEILGRALRDFARRDEVVITSKVFNPMHSGPNGKGLSRKAIMTEIDASLTRLNTDYIDLYQIHRWDYETPLEETLEALHDLVKMGKVRYLGASSMYAWQFCKALHVARENGWTPFIAMQNHLNLLYREEEREMMGLCRAEGIGVTPWSPLARGRLSRPWQQSAATDRGADDAYARFLYTATEQADREVIQAVTDVAARRGVCQAQVALAWLFTKPSVTAPIIGATAFSHLTDAVAATELVLTEQEIAALEAPYIPHQVVEHT